MTNYLNLLVTPRTEDGISKLVEHGRLAKMFFMKPNITK